MNRLSAIGRIAEPPKVADPAVARLRAVHRASTDLRRGAPVLLTGAGPDQPGVTVLSAETAAAGLSDFLALSDGPPMLVLAAARAAALLHRPLEQAEPVSLRIGPALLDPGLLRAIADPTAEQTLPEIPEAAAVAAPQAGPSFALAKIARLLPAVLVAPSAADAAAAAGRIGVVPVPGADVLAYPAEAAAGLQRVAEAAVPLEDAPDARIVAFRTPDGAQEHLAIVIG
ncbi:MAG: GTP cyclohydrolase II, partial [Proteobacteria bacterium]|nr:GTP cyclohydrolase II [Pseudomonadota bacterium]